MGVGLLRNDEYKGIFNAGSRIIKEEGFFALYRGYFAYMLAVRLFKMTLSDHILNEHPSTSNRLHDDEHASYCGRRSSAKSDQDPKCI